MPNKITFNKVKHLHVNKYLLTPFSDQTYFLSYNFKCKALWYRVFKVSTRTINETLSKGFASGDYLYGSEVAYNPGRYDDYFKFAFVRNPIKRFVSAWKDKVLNQNYFHFEKDEHEKMKDIQEFISWVENSNIDKCDEHLRSQNSLIDLNHVDFIGRFENFDHDFQIVCNRLGLKYDQELKLNQSGAKNFNLSEDQVKRIAKIYEKDIRIFYPDLIERD